ncbi:MAG: GTP cyclohydrolase II [Flavobacteriales bacterium]
MNNKKITFSDKAKLPTKHGDFNVISFKEEGDVNEHLFLYKGSLTDGNDVLTRIHSECLTGDVFNSRKCDCGEQLDESMRAIAKKQTGIIVYLRQEGRGIGLFNKINAYALQDQGQDTIQANHSLGFGTDLRNFSIAVKVLEHFKIKSIELLSNNPEKIKIWKDSKIDVTERIPLIMETNEHNLGYLSVKKEKMNHLL